MTGPTCDLLLTGGVVVTIDDRRRVLNPGAVAISGNRITGVGTAAELSSHRADRVIDCTGKAVMPGLIDTHNHLFQGLARSLGEGMSLWPWLRDFMWPYAAAITTAEAAAAVKLSGVESIRAGTTTVLDNHYAPSDLDSTLAVAEAISATGLRAVVARGITGHRTPIATRNGLSPELFPYSPDEEIEITRAAMLTHPRGGRVEVWPAPLNIIYTDQDLVHRAIGLARELGTGWHTHCSEAAADPGIYLDEYGVRPFDWLYREGLLGPEATIAHAIHLSDAEVEEAGDAGVGIAYNPVSNQYLASGVLRLAELRASGAVVGLGTDGACCNHREDMFEVMKQAILLQRVSTLDPATFRAEHALEMATREGARMMGIEAGVLAEGKLADVIVVDLARPHLTPRHREVPLLAYAARGGDVVCTIVDGVVVYEDGACTMVDESEVMAEASAGAAAVVGRAGFEALLTPWRPTDRQGAS